MTDQPPPSERALASSPESSLRPADVTRQGRRRRHRLAVAALTVLCVLALATVVWLAHDTPHSERRVQTASAPVSARSLRVGDCFDVASVEEHRIVSAKPQPCDALHDAQAVARVPLPDVPFPEWYALEKLSDTQCRATARPLVDEKWFGRIALYYLHPESASEWQVDRSVTCLVMVAEGKLTESVLK